jgi:hypothetical protein
MSSTLTSQDLAHRLINIAARDVGKLETSRNQAHWIKKYWSDTSYPTGYANREPYCAAAVCHWLAELARNLAEEGQLRASTGMTLAQFNAWRCKSARAFDWLSWADKRGLTVLDENAAVKAGDLMVFDMSHIGVVSAHSNIERVRTIEANTGATGSRDGDGCFEKVRQKTLARGFIRLFA